MNTEIDSLSFKINITGLSDKKLNELKVFGLYLERLDIILKKADFSNLDYLKNVNELTGVSLKSMAKGLEKLNAVLAKSDFSKLKDLKDVSIFQDISVRNQSLENVKKSANEASEAYDKLSEAQKVLLEKAKQAQQSGKKGISIGLNKKIKKEIQDSEDFEKAAKEYGITEDGKHKRDYYEKPNALVKTLRRIKLIAFIKLIRGALNSIIKGFQSAIQQLAVYSKDFNGTMSQITTNFEKINAALVLTAQPFFEAITPVIQALSGALVEMGNAISKASAQAKGLSTYTRVSADYAKDYARTLQGTLFSFDTFNTLNGQQTPFETAKIDEEDNSEASAFLDIINGIKEAGQQIAGFVKTILPHVNKILKAIMPILTTIINISNRATETILPSIEKILDLIASIIDVIAPIINDILTALEPVIQAINTDLIPPLVELVKTVIMPIVNIIKTLPIKEIVSLIADLLVPAIKVIGNVINIIVKILEPFFENFGSGFFPLIMQLVSALMNMDFSYIGDQFKQIVYNLAKLLSNLGYAIFKLFAKICDWLLNRVIEAINALIANDFIKWITNDLLGQNWQGITWRSDWAGQIKPPDYTSLDEWAGVENASVSSRKQRLNQQLGTSNEAQMARAFEQAIYNTGLIDTIENAGNISIDGKDIAQSKNFKSELNRTNPSLALK